MSFPHRHTPAHRGNGFVLEVCWFRIEVGRWNAVVVQLPALYLYKKTVVIAPQAGGCGSRRSRAECGQSGCRLVGILGGGCAVPRISISLCPRPEGLSTRSRATVGGTATVKVFYRVNTRARVTDSANGFVVRVCGGVLWVDVRSGSWVDVRKNSQATVGGCTNKSTHGSWF